VICEQTCYILYVMFVFFFSLMYETIRSTFLFGKDKGVAIMRGW
jgi:hypothetical protein